MPSKEDGGGGRGSDEDEDDGGYGGDIIVSRLQRLNSEKKKMRLFSPGETVNVGNDPYAGSRRW